MWEAASRGRRSTRAIAFARAEASAARVAEGTETVVKDFFDLTADDLAGVDALVSAFGSGFTADPAINERACEAYVALGRATDVRIVAIVGSGCLYTDASHEAHVYETDGYFPKLRPISEAATRGLAHLDAAPDVAWTAVTPGLQFDSEGPLTGAETLDTTREVVANAAGESYSTYEDVAHAMLDLAVTGDHLHELVCVISPSSK